MTKVEADTIELQIPCDPKYIGRGLRGVHKRH